MAPITPATLDRRLAEIETRLTAILAEAVMPGDTFLLGGQVYRLIRVVSVDEAGMKRLMALPCS